MKFVTKSALAALAIWALMQPSAASAQDGRLTLSLTPAVATASGDSELAIAGTAVYRFSDHFSFEGDMTWVDAAAGGVRDRRFDIDDRLASTMPVDTMLQQMSVMFGGRNRMPAFPSVTLINRMPITAPINMPMLSVSTDGQTWIGTFGVRYEPPVQTARFRPYVSGGLGMNHTNEEVMLGGITRSNQLFGTVSHSGVAFSAGGGAAVRLVSALWLGADAKYFRLSRNRDLMRFGGNVTFKF